MDSRFSHPLHALGGAARLSVRRRLLLLIVGGLASLILAGGALAVVNCGNAGGTICCGNQTYLAYRNVAISNWYGDAGHHYYARRRNLDFELTYNEYIYNGGAHPFDNGYDVVRSTGIYYGGQTQINFAVSQASYTQC